MSAIRAEALAWLKDAALPLWHERGWDAASGGFVERLREDGAPDTAAPRRVRVQMRQVYVYAQAALRGWYAPARGLALETLDFLLTKCRPARGAPGFAHLTDSGGHVIDGRIDAYDQAFGLLALAAAYRLTRDAQLRALIDAEIAFIDAQIVDPATGLWLEGVPGATPRRQNPQMHAFEAWLALYEATGDAAFLARARFIAEALAARFVDPATGALRELFDARFEPLVAGQSVEPGHHFEWVWLLHGYARHADVAPPPVAAGLYDWGARFGLDAGGHAIDACACDGAPLQRTRRLWPQTEFIKANLALEEAGDAEAGARADAGLGRLIAGYLAVTPRGGWVDRFDAAGVLVDGRMPTSSFYHIFAAVAEADRVSPRSAA